MSGSPPSPAETPLQIINEGTEDLLLHVHAPPDDENAEILDQAI
jgi:hypothetical protein